MFCSITYFKSLVYLVLLETVAFHYSATGPSIAEKQLVDRTTDGRQPDPSFLEGQPGVDLTDCDELKLRRKSCFMVEISSSVMSGGGPADLNFLQKFMWRFSASSEPISLSDLEISSLIASEQSPHNHRPSCFSRTACM